MDTRRQILQCIAAVAPEAEAELDTLADEADLREELDLDSMDFLNVLIAVKDATGVEVPERDYPQVRTLATLIAYVDGQRPSAAKK